ncbi:MAG: hypothetical protein ACI3XN_02095 [Eubacteriales bacterium]
MSEHRLNTDFSETKLNTLTPGMCAGISKIGESAQAFACALFCSVIH